MVFELIDGPGELEGTTSFGSFNGYKYIDDWSFTESGSYSIKMTMLGAAIDTLNITIVDEFELCDSPVTNGCSNVGGDSLVYFASTIVSVDAVFPINAALININTGFIDTSWFGVANIARISGPGNLWGTTYIEGDRWAVFIDLRFDQIGNYELEIELDGNTGVFKDTLTIEVVEPSSVSNFEKSDLKVFPNPVKSIINFENINGGSNLLIYSLTGELVGQKNALRQGINTFDITKLPNGIYSFQVFQMDGAIFETRVVKIK